MKQIPHNMNNIFRLLTVVLSVSIGREKKANDTSTIDMKIRLSYDLFSAIYKIGVCVCVCSSVFVSQLLRYVQSVPALLSLLDSFVSCYLLLLFLTLLFIFFQEIIGAESQT